MITSPPKPDTEGTTFKDDVATLVSGICALRRASRNIDSTTNALAADATVECDEATVLSKFGGGTSRDLD